MKKSRFIAIAVVFFCLAANAINPSVPEVHVAQWKDGRQAAVSFTYDDNVPDQYTMVAPRLDSAGIKATFWIIGSSIRNEPGSGMTWDMLRSLQERGHEISNHSWSHKRMTALSGDEVRSEIEKCDDAIEKNLGVRPVTFAYPFNDFNSFTDSILLKDHISYRDECVGQGQGRAKGQGKRYATFESMKKWLDGILEEGSWGVTMTHGIVTGWDQWEHPDDYWNFIRYAGSLSDKVWYGTFREVSSYEKERNACTLTVERKGRNTLKITPSCSLDPVRYTEPLTLEIVYSDGRRQLVEFNPFGGAFTVRPDHRP